MNEDRLQNASFKTRIEGSFDVALTLVFPLQVGEYIVLRVESNFYAEKFHYLVIAKGIILVTGDEVLQNSVRSLAIPLSAEMAPAATVVVYHVGQYGEVVGDSITIPVNGVSRNKASFFLSPFSEPFVVSVSQDFYELRTAGTIFAVAANL